MSAESHFQDVRLLRFQPPSGHVFSYAPGDVLAIKPVNPNDQVDELLNLLGWTPQANQLYKVTPLSDGGTFLDPSLKQKDATPVIPRYATLKTILTQYVEPFRCPKSRYFFELLSHFAVDPQHREKLAEFATAQGQEDLYAYVHRPRYISLI
jgi:sulfite reductase alpha subunit-like flavoprotein